MPNSNHHPDDVVTIAESRERLRENSPTSGAFHKAITRGKLKKRPDQPGNSDVHFRWGDILDYIAAGGFKKCSHKSANPADTVTSFELNQEASPMVTALSCVTAGADTFIDQGPAEFISVDVLPKEMDDEYPSELEEVERLVIVLPSINEEELIKHIKNYSGRAESLANEAVAKGDARSSAPGRVAPCSTRPKPVLIMARLSSG